MKGRPRKLLVLGLDAALPDLLRQFADEGVIPHLAGLMGRGAFSRVITTFPPLTAAAWSAIVTGAGPGTSGVPSLMVHLPGEELDRWHTSFDRRIQLAETLWEAGARGGKRAALINWPVTWPMGIEAGVQVGAALNPPFRFFYMPLWDIASSSLYATRRYPCNQNPGRAVVVTPAPIDPWAGMPAPPAPLLGFEIDLPPDHGRPVRYHVAVLDSRGQGYDEVLIGRTRSTDGLLARLRVGEMSEWITETFQTDSGRRRGRFRFQLVALGQDGRDLRLYASAINTAETYTIPESLTGELERVAGPYMEVDDPWAFMDGWIPFEAYMAQLTAHNAWWAKATTHVLRTCEWDLAFSWVGTIDHIQHVLYSGIEPRSRLFDPSSAGRWLAAIRDVYREADQAVGEMLAAVDLEETLVLAVSDHGFTHLDYFPYIKHLLAKAGLMSLKVDPKTGQMEIDWSKTLCYPLEPGHAHIFINLKGRDPHGIIDPADYARTQARIIDALLEIRDPDTGERIVAVAVPKQDGALLGVTESKGYDRIGDVLFALKPGYMANPYIYRANVKYRDGTERTIANPEEFEPSTLLRNFAGAHLTLPSIPEMHAAMILAGPGVQHVALSQPIQAIDIAPTVARILGIPRPRDAEGRVQMDLLEE